MVYLERCWRCISNSRPPTPEEIAECEAQEAKAEDDMAAVRQLADNFSDLKRDVVDVCRRFGVRVK